MTTACLTLVVLCRLAAAPEPPRMYFADTVSGRPMSKDPSVVQFAGKYWLYYSLPPYEGKPTAGWNIGIATSANLVDWTKVGELSAEGAAEARGFCAPCVLVVDGKLQMFYQTYGNGRRDAICHAWSIDGLHFRRHPGNPVFRPGGAWNSGRAIDAEAIVFRGRLLLYYATRDPAMKVQMVGVAAASPQSGFGRDAWTLLHPEGPILRPTLPWEGDCIEAPSLVERDGRLFMFYAGNYNNRPQQIGVAASADGIHFERLGDRPLLPNGPPGSWNSSESGHPCVFRDPLDRHYLFFQGNNDGGRTWYLSMLPLEWRAGRPELADPRRGP